MAESDHGDHDDTEAVRQTLADVPGDELEDLDDADDEDEFEAEDEPELGNGS